MAPAKEATHRTRYHGLTWVERPGEPGSAAAPVVEVNDLRLDFERHLVTRAGEEVHLTPTECDVLKFLVQHAGKLVTHRMLLHAVWGPDHVGETQYLHVFVSQLRRTLEPQPARPRYILAEPGVGYPFRAFR